MPIPTTKIPYLQKVGLTEKKLEDINAELKEKQKDAETQGLEFKEEAVPPVEPPTPEAESVTPEVTPVESPVVEPVTTPAPVADPVPAVESTPVAPVIDPATPETEEVESAFDTSQVKELSEAFDLFGSGLLTQVKEIVETAVSDLITNTEATQKAQEELKETIGMTPHVSLIDAIVNGNVLKQNSASGSSQTKIDKRTKDAKDSPEEEMASFSGNGTLGFLDDSINDILSGKVIAAKKQ